MYDPNIGRLIIKSTMMGFPLSGYTQIWFLSLIMLCYFMYPYLYYFFYGNGKTEYKKYFILVALLVIFCIAADKGDPGNYNKYEIAITRIPSFLTGCILGKACKEKKNISRSVMLLIILIAIINFIVMYNSILEPYKRIYTRLFYITAISYAFVFAIILDAIKLTWLNKALSFLGNISLQLYLIHIILINLYKKCGFYDPGNGAKYIILLAVAVIISVLADKLQSLIENKLIYRK